MTPRTVRIMLSLGTVTAVAALGSQIAMRPPPPPPPAQPLMWSTNSFAEHDQANDIDTWSEAAQRAADYSETVDGVLYDDWRLPSPEEFTAAVNATVALPPDPAFGTILPNTPAPGLSYWTKKKQGIWAWAAQVAGDAEGDPIPSTLVVKKIAASSIIHSKFVRP